MIEPINVSKAKLDELGSLLIKALEARFPRSVFQHSAVTAHIQGRGCHISVPKTQSFDPCSETLSGRTQEKTETIIREAREFVNKHGFTARVPNSERNGFSFTWYTSLLPDHALAEAAPRVASMLREVGLSDLAKKAEEMIPPGTSAAKERFRQMTDDAFGRG